MSRLSDSINRKFIDTADISDWEVDTDTGWRSITHVHKTIEYVEWLLKLENGLELVCADDHIVFDMFMNEVFVKDLIAGDFAMTKDGPVRVLSIEETSNRSNMYDVTVDSPDHRLYTNDILSHNTTSASAIILHYILFNQYKTVALLANKGDAAREILDRIKLAYEALPMWIQQGIIVWNKGSIELENGCKVIAASSSSSAIRGKSCVTGDTIVRLEYGEDEYIVDIKMAMNFSLPMKVFSEGKYRRFDGFKSMGIKNIFKLTAENISIKCTDDHQFLTQNGWKEARHLIDGDILNGKRFTSLEDLKTKEEVFDAINVEETSSFWANGFTAHNCAFVYIDETAHLTNWDEFFSSVYPTISSGKETKMLLTSTPNGLNHFWKICKEAQEEVNETGEGKNGYLYIEVPWNRIPGRDETWKDKTLASMSFNHEKFDQEFNVGFIGSQGTLISGQHLKNLSPIVPMAQHENIKQYQVPVKGNTYVMTVDVSRGKGLDYSTFSVFDVTKMPYEQVCTFRDNKTGPTDYSSIIFRIATLYNNAYVLVEINDIGGQVADGLLLDLSYEELLFTETHGRGKRISSGFGSANVDRGIRTTTSVKAIGCSILKMLVEQQQLVINDGETISEISRFSLKGKSYEAEPGFHDDMVMTLVLFSWLANQSFFKEITDINTLGMLREKTDEELDDEMLPFGFINSGMEEVSDTPISVRENSNWW